MPTIHIAGESTAAEKDENKRPETGWGEKSLLIFHLRSRSITKQRMDAAPNHLSRKED